MLSVVIPVYEEAETLAPLHAELDEVARGHGLELEIILVDDGSTDGSWSEIERLAARDPRVRGIRFRRNFGKAAALSAGFEAARGELVLTLDADLQDDPQEIPRFLRGDGDAELDVVSGWKKVRHDPVAQGASVAGVQLDGRFADGRAPARPQLRLQVLSPRGASARCGSTANCTASCPVLADARGWKVGEIVVQHRPRQVGRSKYGVHRFVKGFLDLLTVYFLTGFGQRPQHLLGYAGARLVSCWAVWASSR